MFAVKLVVLCAFVGFVICGEEIPIISQKSSIEPDGAYVYSFETGDGTKVEETGEVKQIGTESPVVAHGSFAYTDAEGTSYNVVYVADENGFQPTGDHLPTPPPVPAMIQRALDYLATAPPPTEGKH